MDSVVTTPIKVTCDCEGTGNNFVKQSLDNISERLLTPETLLVDAADSYGVPSPPKSKLVTQHPTLPLSTSDFTVNIELCCYQQRTLQLSTSNY